MTKPVVIAIFVVLLIGVLFLFDNIKQAYKVLPPATTSMEVPAYSDWREFVAQSGKFSALLPITPQYAKATTDIPNTDKKRKYDMYVSEKINGTVFMVSLITYPEDIDTSNNDQMLKDIVNEIVNTNTANKLQSMEDSIYQNQKSLDFHIVNQDLDIEGKTFIIDKIVYLLTYVAKHDDFDQKEYDHFIDHFKIVDTKP